MNKKSKLISINGARLKEELLRRGTSPIRFSEENGMSRNWISNAVSRNYISPTMMALLEAKLNIKLDDLIDAPEIEQVEAVAERLDGVVCNMTPDQLARVIYIAVKAALNGDDGVAHIEEV